MKLEQLSKEQIAKMSEVKQYWLNYIFSCKNTIDRENAKMGIDWLYRFVGRPEPIVVFVESPMACQYAIAYVKEFVKQVPQLFGGDQVRAQVGAQVGAQVWAQVGDQVRAQVGAQVRAQVGAQVRDQVGAQVWDQVGAQVGAQVWDQVYRAGYGQHDAGWLSFYATFSRAKIEACERLAGIMAIAKSAGWWWPFSDAVILTERPELIERDPQGRLHAERGPAMRYRDGWSLYVWHGVRVPADIIETPTGITLQRIKSEANAEVRRIMIEIYGIERYVLDAGLKPIQADDYGTLYQEQGGGIDPLTVVKVFNATPEADGSFKPYFLPVHPELRPLPDPDVPGDELGEPQELRALNAVASTFGLRGHEYAPMIET